MNEKESDFSIPKDLQVPSDKRMEEMITGNPTDEPFANIELKPYYKQPYLLAERLRKLKEEYRCQNPTPGAERRIEITEECQRLQDQQDNLHDEIIRQIQEKRKDLKAVLRAASESQKCWLKIRQDGERDNKSEQIQRAEMNIRILTDFLNLFQDEI